VYASKKSLAFPLNDFHEIHKSPTAQYSDPLLNFTQIRQEPCKVRM